MRRMGSTRRPIAPGPRRIPATCCARWTASIRFPTTPEFAASWAEWLYFNGHTRRRRAALLPDVPGRPASAAPGRRVAGVRLQLDRDGKTTTYAAGARCRRRAAARDGAGSRHRRQPRAARRLALPDHAGAAGREPATLRARRRARPIAAAGDDSRRARLADRLHRAGAVGRVDGSLDGRRRRGRIRGRRRLSRSQLGILEGRALAVGPGRARRSVVHLRPRVSAGGRRRPRTRSGISRRARARRPARLLDRRCRSRNRRRRRSAAAASSFMGAAGRSTSR